MKEINEDEAGFQFPCDYQVKAMGHDDGEFQNLVVEILTRHCQEIDHEKIVCKASKGGKYLSVSVTIEAQSREHLDAIYDELTAHEKVLMRL